MTKVLRLYYCLSVNYTCRLSGFAVLVWHSIYGHCPGVGIQKIIKVIGVSEVATIIDGLV